MIHVRFHYKIITRDEEIKEARKTDFLSIAPAGWRWLFHQCHFTALPLGNMLGCVFHHLILRLLFSSSGEHFHQCLCVCVYFGVTFIWKVAIMRKETDHFCIFAFSIDGRLFVLPFFTSSFSCSRSTARSFSFSFSISHSNYASKKICCCVSKSLQTIRWSEYLHVLLDCNLITSHLLPFLLVTFCDIFVGKLNRHFLSPWFRFKVVFMTLTIFLSRHFGWNPNLKVLFF